MILKRVRENGLPQASYLVDVITKVHLNWFMLRLIRTRRNPNLAYVLRMLTWLPCGISPDNMEYNNNATRS
jgi:hypothetical protein